MKNVFLVDELLLVNLAIRASGERSSSTTRLNTLFPRSFQISAKRRGAYWKEGDQPRGPAIKLSTCNDFAVVEG